MKFSKILLILVVAVLLFTFWQAFSQPGVGDLAGDYKEIGMYRNENNTGPIIRIYAVTTPDTLWEEMRTYGDLMPHTKYGSTKVYFFPVTGKAPSQLFPGEENFDPAFKQHCLASYEKNNMGKISFKQFPFSAESE